MFKTRQPKRQLKFQPSQKTIDRIRRREARKELTYVAHRRNFDEPRTTIRSALRRTWA